MKLDKSFCRTGFCLTRGISNFDTCFGVHLVFIFSTPNFLPQAALLNFIVFGFIEAVLPHAYPQFAFLEAYDSPSFATMQRAFAAYGGPTLLGILAIPTLQSAHCTTSRLRRVVAVRLTQSGALSAEQPLTCFLMSNVRVEAGPTASRQARAGENVPRTTGPGLVACRWASPRTRG